MDIFSVLQLGGGLALFLFGMNVMGQGLEKVAGGRLERTLEKLTDNPLKAVLLGAGVTSVIQSSSATTVMVVGFVNSGIMKLSQAVGVIMGANIGTTVTSWLLSLTGIQSSSLWVQLLKPDSFSPLLALVGVVLLMMARDPRKKDAGSILLGFAVLMTGMSAMSGAVAPLADSPSFANILLMFSNPVLGVLAGTVLTAVIQSSSASVGILQALAVTGVVPFSTALPIIMGQNIGTCATALISCIGANKNARRAAMVHLYFNLIGTAAFLGLYYGADAIFHFSFAHAPVRPLDIAIVHSIFNVFSTLLLLPFSKWLEKLAVLTIRDKKAARETTPLLDERLLATPAVALEQCRKVTLAMAQESSQAIRSSIAVMESYRQPLADEIERQEKDVDHYEDLIGTYLIQLSSRSLTLRDSNEVSMLLHCIGDFERISDHAVNLTEVAREMRDKGLAFSAEAKAELAVLTHALDEILSLTLQAFQEENVELAAQVEPLEQVVDQLKNELRSRHIARMRRGECTQEMGFVYSDLLTNYERVSDHCSNIAVALIEIHQMEQFNTHEYLNEVKSAGRPAYTRAYADFLQKYTLP
ncbi:MAG: Na/Pi cotransporter family protein [Eubacteriales bacterium]|nr:Na/Pi cotransporter family protein [Eubacteriales bacterium]